MSPTLDPQLVNLAKSLRENEGGEDPTKRGKSGEYGMYQWLPDTWAKEAPAVGVNVPLEQSTKQQQNEVAYKTLETMKKAHPDWNVGQFASWWNSGSPDNYNNDHRGTNSQGVSYDTPAYSKKVAESYQKFKSQTPQDAVLGTSTEQKDPGLSAELGGRANDIGGAYNLGAQGVAETLQGQKLKGAGDIASGVLQTAGHVAGGVGDIVNAGLGLIPGVKQVEKGIGYVAGKIGATEPAQVIGKAYDTLPSQWKANLGAVGNIATAFPMLKGLGVAKEAIASGVGKALGKDALQSTIEDISPGVNAKTAASQAEKYGLQQSLLSGKITSTASPINRTIAETVTKYVPGFDKLKTFTEKLNSTREAAYKLADDLKQAVIQSGADKIYSFKELNSRLRNIVKPIAIRADTTLSRQFDMARNAAIKIAREKGGTISSLFDARKAFDDLVSKEFPNLYDRANAPMRNAITAIRREMNDFVAEQLPDVGFKESLQAQSHLWDAIGNIAPKAVDEIGTTRIGRFASNHPLVGGLIKTVGKGLVEGSGAGAAIRTLGGFK